METSLLVLLVVLFLPGYIYLLSRVVFWCYFKAKQSYQLDLMKQMQLPERSI